MARVRVEGSVDLTIDVGARLGVNTDSLTTAARDQLESAIDDLAWQLGEFIDLIWPVDTGASQADWESAAEDLIWVIRNPREYAEFVHRKGETVEVYTQIEAESERILAGKLSVLRAIAAAGLKETTAIPQPIPAPPRQPSVVSRLGDLFGARVRGFQLQSTRSRERDRARLRAR